MATVSKADIAGFKRTLNLVRQVSRKTEAEIVNNALRDVAYYAASFTPKAPAGATIALSLQQNGLLPALAAQALNRRLGKNPKKGPKVWGRVEHQKEMARILKRARSGVNAIRAGFGQIVMELGGSFRGAKSKSGRTAAKSTAKKATVSNLSGFFSNKVRDYDRFGKLYGAGDIPAAQLALRQAIRYITARELKYAQKKMSDALRKVTKR